MPTSVALSPRLEAFVRDQVDAGRYNNVSEVVRDGLRLLERRQQEDAVSAAPCGAFQPQESRDTRGRNEVLHSSAGSLDSNRWPVDSSSTSDVLRHSAFD